MTAEIAMLAMTAAALSVHVLLPGLWMGKNGRLSWERLLRCAIMMIILKKIKNIF